MDYNTKKPITFNDLPIFSKLIIAFLIIILLPLTIMFIQSRNTVSDVVVEQLSNNSINSLQLVGNSVDSLFKRMNSIALYVNEDKSIKDLLEQENDSFRSYGNATKEQRLEKLTRINMLGNIIDNLAFNMVGTKCYITILTNNNGRFSNWSYDGPKARAYFDSYADRSGVTNLVWKGIEDNYVDRDEEIAPRVITMEKCIFDPAGKKQFGTFIISIPENEISKLMDARDNQQERFLLDKDGRIVSATEKQWLGRTGAELPGLKPFTGKEDSYLLRHDGQEKLFTYYTFGSWTLLDISSYETMNEAIGRTQNSLLFSCLVLGGIFIFFSALIAGNISRPLKQLTDSMLNADPDNFTEDIRTDRKDEIGILQNSFATMKLNIRQLMQENLEKEKRKREDELKLLQAQISPHFLFNTLNTIRWAAINNNTQKVADMVPALLNLLRMTIVKGDELITVDEEVETLRSYAVIFQMRHSVAVELSCRLDEKVRRFRIPKLLLQPLVENALIHGFEGIDNGKIEIAGHRVGDRILLAVKDNGIGMEAGEPPSSGNDTRKTKFSGMGIHNVDERIKLYYGDSYGLAIQSKPGEGTLIQVWLPGDDESEGDTAHD